MRILPGNAQHIGARHSQQDSFGFADPNDQSFLSHAGFLAVICDGMGGMEHGDAASRAAVKAFLESYARKTPEESIPEALHRGVLEANQEVVTLAAQLGLVDNMGTTLIAAAITGGAMYYVSVGDSALYLVSGGRFQMLNHAHVFANLLDKAVARGVMSREDAESHPERESLTSYIGAEKLDEIDRNTEAYMLSEGDAILLATDGMFKTLDNSEILACLTGNPHLWPEALVDRTMAKKREHQDNVTVLSVSMENGDAPAAHRPLAIDETKTLQISRPPQEAAVPMTPVAAAVAPAAPVPPSAPAVAPAATPVATPIATPVATPSAGPVAGPSAGPSATPVAAPVAAAPKAAAAAVPGWTAKPISPPPAELVKSGKPLNSARFTLAAAVILLLVILIGTVAGLQYRAHHQPHPPAAQSASPEPAPVPLETPPPPASDKARQVPAAASGAKGRGRGATKEHGAPRAEHDAPPPATQ